MLKNENASEVLVPSGRQRTRRAARQETTSEFIQNAESGFLNVSVLECDVS